MVDDIQTPCIYCGSLRSPGDAVCPSCGEAWIDEHVTPPPPEQVDLHNIDEELIDDAAPDSVSDERGSLESLTAAALTDTDADPWGDDDIGVDAFDEEEEQDIDSDFSMGNEADVEEDDLDDSGVEDDDFEDEEEQDSAEIDGDKDLDDAGDEDEGLEEAGPDFDELNEQQEEEDFEESDAEMSETVTSSSVAADVTMTPVRSMYERKDSNLRLPLGLLAAAALAIIAWLSWFQGTDTPPPTTALVAQTTAAQAPSTTTQPTTTTSTTSSTATSSTTTSITTTTTLVPIPAIGSPLNLAELTMGGFAFGPFSFGSDGDQVLGRLTATLGQPDALGPADINWGLCETDVGTVVTWGGIAAIFRVQNDVSRFVGYRVGDTTGIDEADAGTSLKTLSGVALGDTVETLRFVYANSVVEVFDRDGQPYFRLLRSDTRRLLLYGPISLASDDGAILGIFAPDACG